METTRNATQGGPSQDIGIQGNGERTEVSESRGRATLIDKFLPSFDLRVDSHIVVNASPGATFEALLDADFADLRSPLLRGALALRTSEITRIRKKLGLSPLSSPGKFRLDDVEEFGRIRLGEDPGREIAIGVVVQIKPYKPETLFTSQVTSGAFRSFDTLGYMKGVGSFQVRPYGLERSLLSYEARVRAMDDSSRRRLFLVAEILRPITELSMRSVLKALKCATEEGLAKRRVQATGANAPS